MCACFSGFSDLQGDSLEESILKMLKKDLKYIIGLYFCYFYSCMNGTFTFLLIRINATSLGPAGGVIS